MNIIRKACVCAMVLLLMGLSAYGGGGKDPKAVVETFLKACETGDVETALSCFDSNLRAQSLKRGGENREELRKVAQFLRSEIVEIKNGDLSGDTTEVVLVMKNGKERHMSFAKEGGEWKFTFGRREVAMSIAAACTSNLKMLGLAVVMYVDDNDGRFPVNGNWQKVLLGYCGESKCFARPFSKRTYHAMLGDKALSLKELRAPGKVILFMDAQPCADGKYHCLFADGHVEVLEGDKVQAALKQTKPFVLP